MSLALGSIPSTAKESERKGKREREREREEREKMQKSSD
jgi:hypothetical protein